MFALDQKSERTEEKRTRDLIEYEQQVKLIRSGKVGPAWAQTDWAQGRAHLLGGRPHASPVA